MPSRTLPSSFDPAIVAAIDAEIGRVEREQQVALPLVIESGSRAWGFPSPDSDYDCRFIFVRREEAYLTLFPRRDVIEVPLSGDLDINGWDLAKALRLMLKGMQWCWSGFAHRSPIAAIPSSATRSWHWHGSARTGS
jgi:predicted nucleotidyltransferase